MMLRSACLGLLLAFAPAIGAAPAFAQEDPVPTPASAPMELLSDLAESLGEAHSVRSACNGDADQTWRNYMLTFLSIEAPSGPRRQALMSSFNRGFRNQSSRTSTCTADMPAIEAGIARRGRELAEAVARSYLE